MHSVHAIPATAALAGGGAHDVGGAAVLGPPPLPEPPVPPARLWIPSCQLKWQTGISQCCSLSLQRGRGPACERNPAALPAG